MPLPAGAATCIGTDYRDVVGGWGLLFDSQSTKWPVAFDTFQYAFYSSEWETRHYVYDQSPASLQCTSADLARSGQFAVCASSLSHVVWLLNMTSHTAPVILVGTYGQAGYVPVYDTPVTGTSVLLNQPAAVAIAPDGSFVLACDQLNHRVLKLDLTDGTVVRLVTGVAKTFGVVIAPAQDFAWFSDYDYQGGFCMIWRVRLDSWFYATSVWRMQSSVSCPWHLLFSLDGSYVLAINSYNGRLECIGDPGAEDTSYENNYPCPFTPSVTYLPLSSGRQVTSVAWQSTMPTTWWYTRFLWTDGTSDLHITYLNEAFSDVFIQTPGVQGTAVVTWSCFLPGHSSNGLCDLCPSGTYSALGGACTRCAAGMFAAGRGQSACGACVNAVYTISACTACVPGKYYKQSENSCQQCAMGLFTDTTLVSSCLACSVGTYTSAQGASTCMVCAKGSFCVGGQSQTCLPGSFSNASAQSACSACGVGQYSPVANSTSCLTCADGTNPVGTAPAASSACFSRNTSWAVVAPLQPAWPSSLQLAGGLVANDTAALMATCTSMAISGDGLFAVCASATRHVLLLLRFWTRRVTTLFGVLDEAGSDLAHLHGPAGVAVSSDGTFVVVCDQSNNRVLKLDISATIATAVHVLSPDPFWSRNNVELACIPPYNNFIWYDYYYLEAQDTAAFKVLYTPLLPSAVAISDDGAVVYFSETGDPSGQHHVWVVLLSTTGSCWHELPVTYRRVWSTTADTIMSLALSPSGAELMIAGRKRLSCLQTDIGACGCPIDLLNYALGTQGASGEYLGTFSNWDSLHLAACSSSSIWECVVHLAI